VLCEQFFAVAVCWCSWQECTSCSLWSCRIKARCVPCEEVIKGVPNQGLICFVSYGGFSVYLFLFRFLVFVCQYQCNWLPGKTRLWNNLSCVMWDVKPYTVTHIDNCRFPLGHWKVIGFSLNFSRLRKSLKGNSRLQVTCISSSKFLTVLITLQFLVTTAYILLTWFMCRAGSFYASACLDSFMIKLSIFKPYMCTNMLVIVEFCATSVVLENRKCNPCKSLKMSLNLVALKLCEPCKCMYRNWLYKCVQCRQMPNLRPAFGYCSFTFMDTTS